MLKLINTIVESYDTVTERYGVHAHLTALGLKKALQKLSEAPDKDQYEMLRLFRVTISH